MIAGGRVRVNGVVADLGCKVSGREAIEVDGKRLQTPPNTHTYIILNKPRGVITTMSDEQGRPCVADILSEVAARVVPVGRLDRNSEGLLLFTDDGALAHKITHPRYGVEKQYIVTLRGFAGGDLLERLRSVRALDGQPIKPVQIEVLEKTPDRSLLRFTLTEGRNHQIRRMCEQADAQVIRLKRVSLGGLKLRDLKAGQWRHLTRQEVSALKSLVQRECAD